MKLLAQLNLPGGLGEIKFPESRFDSARSIGGAAITWLLWLAGALAVIAIIYSGIMYITSAGNQEQAEKAKKNLIWAIIGIILIALSLAIVAWVQTMLVPTTTP